MRMFAPLMLSFSLLLAPLAAQAAPITVTVDGRYLDFPGAGAQMIRGRVMVPLRGIFEALGAGVTWDGPTQTINATRAATNVELRLGDRTGYVNGLPVALDVPAMLLNNTTMVPLRFVSESLDADVGWSTFTQTVAITTRGAIPVNQPTPPVTPPMPGAPDISSFTHNAGGWLNSNSVLQVELSGTPNSQASFSIPGIVKDAPMREVSAGRYQGDWRPSAGQNDLTVTGAAVLGSLKAGVQTSMIQAGATLSVDTQAPRITAVAPLPDSRLVPQPNVSAVFDDLVGSGIDPATVRMELDNSDITGQAVVTGSFVSFRPNQPLPAGDHQVSVSAADQAGNRVDRTWRFRTIDVAQVVRSFRWTTVAGAGPGDTVTITLEANPGGKAQFAVGKAVKNQPMPEVQNGLYVGEYVLRRGDRLADLKVTGTFTTREGQSYEFEAENTSAVVAPAPGTNPTPQPGELVAPLFTSPSPDQRVGAAVVIKGTGPRNGRVGMRVEYRTKLMGVLPVGGALTELAVDIDADGRWQTPSINLSTLLAGRDTEYIVTAWTIGADNQKSDGVTLRLLHQ